MPYLMSKKGDWDRPGKESITPAEGREPGRDNQFSLKTCRSQILLLHQLVIHYISSRSLGTYLKEGLSVAEGHE